MRVIAFISLIFLSTLLPWYLVAVLGVAYALYWHAYELIVLAVCIDAYFGAYAVLPYYTLSTLCLLLITEWAKPALLVYNR